ncbi:MAG: VTT domain-containing protein [Oscillospiraceae bacterium]|nr:VTT domain-containing protein [Oscillospiraceae bacterium]
MNPAETTPRPRRGERIAIAAILAVILLLFFIFLKNVMLPLIRLELRHDLVGAQQLLREEGAAGALSVVLIEALQMLVVFIPAEFIQISSALSYPVWVSVPLCDLGVCLGASIIFLLVRRFRVSNLAFEKRRDRIERLSAELHERNTILLLYLLFFMPFIPFGAICYYGAGTKLPYRKYILTVASGVLPSVVVSNLMGAAGTAFLINDLPLWQLVLVILALAALLFALILVFIRRVCFRGREGTPDSMMYAFIFFLVRLWLGRRQKIEIDDAALREVEPPYILLSNHESFEDFYYISRMAHPRNPSYLVNEYYCTRPVLKSMAKRGGILSKKLFTPDLAAPVGILRMIRKGYPVVIFPEGRLSPDGRTNPIAESGAALYRRLKSPLVLVRIDGAYWAHPKWRKKRFRSDIRVSVRRVLGPEELAALSDAQLDELIRETLYNDASEHLGGVYPQRNKAVGLDGLLYRCADCGALYRTEGVGNELICRACGSRHRLDERYRFTDAPGTITAYYGAIRDREAKELDALDLRAEVKTKIFGADGGPVRWEKGVCTLDTEAFRYRSENEDFSIPTEKLPALAFSCSEEFELYHEGELHYFYPLAEPRQCARWALAVDLLTEKRKKEGESKDGKA